MKETSYLGFLAHPNGCHQSAHYFFLIIVQTVTKSDLQHVNLLSLMVTNKNNSPYLFCNILSNNFRKKEYFAATISLQNFSSRRFGNFTTLKCLFLLSPHSLIQTGNVLRGTESTAKVEKYNIENVLTNKKTKYLIKPLIQMYLLVKSKSTTQWYTSQNDSRFKVRICFLQIFALQKHEKSIYKTNRKH